MPGLNKEDHRKKSKSYNAKCSSREEFEKKLEKANEVAPSKEVNANEEPQATPENATSESQD